MIKLISITTYIISWLPPLIIQLLNPRLYIPFLQVGCLWHGYLFQAKYLSWHFMSYFNQLSVLQKYIQHCICKMEKSVTGTQVPNIEDSTNSFFHTIHIQRIMLPDQFFIVLNFISIFSKISFQHAFLIPIILL